MKVMYIIAMNTFREIIRDRILYGLVIFSLLLIGLSLALGQLSFTEQSRISANFGFTSIHIVAVILSIFIGSTLVSKEIDKKTIMTLLARPITRLQFLLGKSFGLLLVVVTVTTGLAIVLGGVFIGLGMDINLSFLVGLHGIMLEAMLLLGFALLFSTFSSPILVVTFSLSIFLIGHWTQSLLFLAEKGKSEEFKSIAKVIYRAFPDLEIFNWRSLVIYGDPAPLYEVAVASGYMLSWFSALLILSAIVVRKKDFG